MIDRRDPDDRRLSPDLAELQSELESIRHAERSSFGPELHAELEREWAAPERRRRWPVRHLLAAGVAALLMVGLGVPSARAALVDPAMAVLVRMVEAVHKRLGETPPAEPRPITVPALPASATTTPPAPETHVHVTPHTDASPDPNPDPPSADVAPEVTLPELMDRPGAEALVRSLYPPDLQRAKIGGVVGLQLWVDSTGAVEVAKLASSSGNHRLDEVALRVAPTLRFEPARRDRKGVGTWVEFDVRFQVPSADSVRVPDVHPPSADMGGGTPSRRLPGGLL